MGLTWPEKHRHWGPQKPQGEAEKIPCPHSEKTTTTSALQEDGINDFQEAKIPAPLHPRARRGSAQEEDRSTRVPAYLDAARPVGHRCLRYRGTDHRSVAHAGRHGCVGQGRHAEGLHGGPGNDRPGILQLEPEGQRITPVPRISGHHRPGQYHPSLSGREVGSVRRSQDLDLQSQEGREVEQRR